MISSADAAGIAKRELPRLTEENITDIRVEEIELSEDELYWYITLGYSAKIEEPSFFAEKYKTFKIQSKDGAVVAMKMRKVQ